MKQLALILLLIASPAAADPEDLLDHTHGAASLEYEAGAVGARGAGLGLAGARLRGQIGGDVFEYRVGLDLHAGMTIPAGFAYDVDLYPIGVGLRLGRWSRFGIVGGVGASGAVGTMDDGAEFPVEASLELALGGRLRLLARGRVAWIVAAPGRRGGVRDLPFGDEAEASIALRLGHRWTDYGFPTGNGYYVGAQLREAGGVRMWGAVVGHSIDVGSE